MEFVGNQINVKTILATVTAAFFIGRVHLFDGTFPAAIAMMTVMVAVSTVYIYLAPVMAAGMLTMSAQSVDIYADMMALLLCGVCFLFFHRARLTINQRTAAAVFAVVVCNFIYYGASHILYLLSLEALFKEAIAVMVYIRVFNAAAKALFAGGSQNLSGEKAIFAAEIVTISLIGAVNVNQVIYPLWIFGAAAVQYCGGIHRSLEFSALAAVYALCGSGGGEIFFLHLFAGLVCGWFGAALVEGRYRKAVLGIVLFACTAAGAREYLYGIAFTMAVFILLPAPLLHRMWFAASDCILPQKSDEIQLYIDEMRQRLRRKKRVFSDLSKLYGQAAGGRQMLAFQFEGMARTVEQIMAELDGGRRLSVEGRSAPVAVGSATYSFEGVSGDSCKSFSFGRTKQALVISDGMGKGEKAQAESRLVVATLSHLLEAGFDIDLAMKTVNAILLEGNRKEMFATLDLAVIDKESHKVQIFKMGAASTFVRHGGKVSMLKRPALPAGIVDGVKLEYIDVRLKRGDLLIMVSDGVTDCDRKDPDCSWLRKRLLEIGSRDPETVAELIVNKAAEKYGIRERDDLTVMVAAI